MKIELSSQKRREMRLFLTSNMAAVTSRANQQIAATKIRLDKFEGNVIWVRLMMS